VVWADIEVFSDSVGESVEFHRVDFSWVLCVDFASSFLNPFPFTFSDGVVMLFGNVFESNLDFII
jgi:hypothetical protein